MDDLRTRLERIGRRAQPSSDAFERLTRSRLRRERKRRIVAGGVALLVAVAGSIGVFALVDDTRVGRVGGSNDDGFFALWPDQTAEGLAAAQESVAAGDPGSAWRTDPIETARRFALEKLLWPAVEIEVPDGSDLEADVMVLDLGVPFEASCNDLVADARCPTARTTVTMRRSASGDPWVVEAVHGEDVILPFAPGDVVSSGTWIRVPTNLPDGAKVSMGLAFLSACEGAGVDDNVVASGGLLEFYVPAVPEGCTGYVYAMLPPTGAGAVAIGSFLFTNAEVVPAIGYLVDQVAAVPVRFVNDTPTDVAEFTCDETGTISPSASAVIAQPDGVHVAMTNTGDAAPVSFSVEVGGDGAAPGARTETVWQLPPGETQVTCSVIVDGGPGVASSASLNVVDPNGYYVPTDLQCVGGEAYGEAPAYADGATGVVGDPVQVVRDHVSGLEFDDAVERAAYPESEQPVVRIVRAGASVGLVTLFDDGQGGWLVSSIEGCSGTQFGWSDAPTGVTGPPGPSSDWQEICAEAYAGTGDNIHRGADLHVDGVDVAFDTHCLVAPAGEPLTILFSNLDAGIQRNISVYAMTPCLRERAIEQRSPGGCLSEQAPERRFAGEIITGVSEIVYRLEPLEPGEYYFQDDVHPAANGVLLVRPLDGA